MHLYCIPLLKAPKGKWFCPHHQCQGRCNRKGSAAGFLFRCEKCPLAYCEDCLPKESEIIGIHSERYTQARYRSPGNACYIHCSEACAKADVNEVRPIPIEEISPEFEYTPHAFESLNANGTGSSGSGVADGTDSLEQVRLAACRLKDIQARLQYNTEYRFLGLREIPLFEQRWAQASSQVKGLLYHMLDECNRSVRALSTTQPSLSSSSSSSSAAPPTPSVPPAPGSAQPMSMEQLMDIVYNFRGLSLSPSPSLPTHATTEGSKVLDMSTAFPMFLKLISVITTSKADDVCHLGYLLGIGLVTAPFGASTSDEERGNYVPEPRFKDCKRVYVGARAPLEEVCPSQYILFDYTIYTIHMIYSCIACYIYIYMLLESYPHCVLCIRI